MSKKVQIAKFTAIFDPAEEGGYTVTVPSLPGCITEGDTFEEAMEMAKDAIGLFIEEMKANDEPIPYDSEDIIVRTINVPVESFPRNV
jgi:antitoxin HicB